MKEKVTPTQRALNLWAVILIVWSIYRTYLKMPEWFDEFIAKPLVFVLPLYLYIKKIDKKSFLSGINLDLRLKSLSKDFIYSLMIGGLFVMTLVIAVLIKTGNINSLIGFPGMNSLLFIVVTALATGITEEILSRGFVLKKLYEESKNIYSSTFFASILFFFLHVPILFTNYKINGNMLLIFMATDLMLSMINGLIFLQRKSLTVPILIHAYYNIIIALVFI